jgi:hypothetical protein
MRSSTIHRSRYLMMAEVPCGCQPQGNYPWKRTLRIDYCINIRLLNAAYYQDTEGVDLKCSLAETLDA